MNDQNLHLEIATPTRTFYNDEVEKFTFKATSGEMTILKNHVPIMTLADLGIMHITDLKGNKREATLFGGSVLVENNKILVVTDDALWPEEIDIRREEEAKRRAEEKLHATKYNRREFVQAEHKLRKALVRIDLANTYEGISRHKKY